MPILHAPDGRRAAALPFPRAGRREGARRRAEAA